MVLKKSKLSDLLRWVFGSTIYHIMKNLINFKDKRFKVLRIIPVEDKPIIETWKDYLIADIVLRKDNNFFFCEEIKEADVIEEWVESDSERWLKEHKRR